MRIQFVQKTTLSGISLPVVCVQGSHQESQYVLEHPALIRITHWVNVMVVFIMVGSGLQILAAFPSFSAKLPTPVEIPIPASVRIGSWLGGGIQWHLTWMWFYSLNGLIYIGYQVVSGRWRMTFVRLRDLPGIWPMVRYYFFLGPKPIQTEPYNPLQKLAYFFAISSGAVLLLTGWMLYRPVQLQTLVQLCGGFGMVRVWHFLGMCGLLAFIPGHLVMVGLHGWNNFQSMLTGMKRDPDYISQ